MSQMLRVAPLADFSCLCERCEDTCCKAWSMQLDAPTLDKYRTQAPELLAAVEQGSGGSDAEWIMRKDPESGYCVKFDGGRCGIHTERGEDWLGDACFFYPRATRALGGQHVMSAALSCPEIARLALFSSGDEVFLQPAHAQRLPHSVKDYAPQGMESAQALALHQLFLEQAVSPAHRAAHTLLRLISVSRSLATLESAQWPGAAPVFLMLADGRIPPAQPNINDAFNLLHALMGLVVATRKPPSARLKQTIDDMEQALAVRLDWANVGIAADSASAAALERLQARWNAGGAALYDDVLKKYVRMQLSLGLFPFAGLGADVAERMTLIAIRFATIKLALMCKYGMHEEAVPPEMVVRIVQSVSRCLDHLGDPAFSLQIYKEAGWVQEARLRALIEL